MSFEEGDIPYVARKMASASSARKRFSQRDDLRGRSGNAPAGQLQAPHAEKMTVAKT